MHSRILRPRAAILRASAVRRASLTSSAVVLDDLLARIVANPEDEGARAVYADALTEADDPRGELMRIGDQQVSTDPARKLLIANTRHWINIGDAINKNVAVAVSGSTLAKCEVGGSSRCS